MLKRTPIIAVFIAALLTILTILIFEAPERPFTTSQIILLYFLSYLVSQGIAMLFDPNPKRAKEEFLKINFYEEND